MAADAIRYGLGAVKGTGDGRSRRSSPRARRRAVHDLFDFCARVDSGLVNRRAVEALIRAGAFDRINPARSSLLASVGLALDWAETQAAHADQGGLFDALFDNGDTHGASSEEPALHKGLAVGFVDEDAVRGHDIRTQDAEFLQILHWRHAIVFQTVVAFLFHLGNVDQDGRMIFPRQGSGILKRLLNTYRWSGAPRRRESGDRLATSAGTFRCRQAWRR